MRVYNAVHRGDEFRLEHHVRAVAGILSHAFVAVKAVCVQKYPLTGFKRDIRVSRLDMHHSAVDHEEFKVRMPVQRDAVSRNVQRINIVLYREIRLAVLDKLLKVLLQRHVEFFHLQPSGSVYVLYRIPFGNIII